jgi:hypothetical protein
MYIWQYIANGNILTLYVLESSEFTRKIFLPPEVVGLAEPEADKILIQRSRSTGKRLGGFT